MHVSTDYVLFQLNALDAMYSKTNNHVTSVKMTMNGSSNTTRISSEKVNGAAQIALKGVCDYYNVCFNLDKAKLKEMLSDNIEFKFVRMKGGFENSAPSTLTGVEEVCNFFNRYLFDMTSNFTVREMQIEFNGANATVDIHVDEDKTVDGKTTRVHMHCHDFIQFDASGKIATFLERNSMNPLAASPTNAN